MRHYYPATRLWRAAFTLSAICCFAPHAHSQTQISFHVLPAEETDAAATVEVLRSGVADSVLTVDFLTEDVDAEAGRDYVAQHGTLRFEPGEETKQIRVQILDDGQVEREELFRVKFLNPSPGLTLAEEDVLVSILDNERPGSVDESFNPAVAGFPSLAMPGGKVLVTILPGDSAKDAPRLVLINEDGTVDQAFRAAFAVGDGIVWVGRQGTDKILVLKCSVVATEDTCLSLVRLNSDGTRDPSFHSPPGLKVASLPSPFVLRDGKVVVGILDTPGALARLNDDGTLDNTFQAALVEGVIQSFVQLADQTIVINALRTAPDGNLTAVLYRLKADGQLDSLFQVSAEFSWVRQLFAATDGAFYVSARSSGDVGAEKFFRLTPTGASDPSFVFTDAPRIFNYSFFVLGTESDGRIIGQSGRGIVRLNLDGSWDRSYLVENPCNRGGRRFVGEGTEGIPRLVLPDGRLLSFESGVLLLLDPASAKRSGFRITAADCASCCQTQLDISESAGQTLVRIQRLGESSGKTAVRLSTRPLTSSAKVDFESLERTLTFDSLETSKTVAVGITSDYTPEADETLEVILTDLTVPQRVWPGNRATVTILDDDRVGSRDLTFQPPIGYQIVGMQSDGKLLGGQTGSMDARIRRFRSDAQLDPSWFEPDLSQIGLVSKFLGLQSDGKIYATPSLVGPGITANLFRLNSDGTIDSSFQPKFEVFPVSGIQIRQNVQGVLVQPDGTILVAIETDRTSTGLGSVYHVARFKSNGEMDPGFAPVKAVAFDLKIFPATSGQVWLAGFLYSVNDVSRRAIVRLNPNGSVDESFALGLVATNISDAVSSHLKLADGGYLLGGRFQFTNEARQRFLIRLADDGKLDPAFAPQLEAPFVYIGAMAQQSDGKILVTGEFDTINGVARHGLARLNLDGSVDLTFDSGQQALPAERIFVQPDGQILVDLNTDWQRFNGDKRAAVIAQPPRETSFQAEVISYSEQRVIIEATDTLLPPDWRPIWTNSAAPATPLIFADLEGRRFPMRFYRAISR